MGIKPAFRSLDNERSDNTLQQSTPCFDQLPRQPTGKVSALQATNLGLVLAFTINLFQGLAIPVP